MQNDGVTTFISTSSVIMVIGMLLLLTTVISLNTTLNYNINKRVNRIFLFGGLKRNQIKNYALIYNAILLMIQALIAIIMCTIIFGIATLSSDFNSIKAIINL